MRFSVRQVAEMMEVDEDTVYKWVKEDGMPAYHVNNQCRFNEAELQEWAATRNIRLPLAEFGNSGNAVTVRVADALQAGGIQFGVRGNDKESALRAVVDRLPLPNDVDRSTLLKLLLARESLGSTAIGDGIAIPHVRNPIVLHINTPLAMLSYLDNGIDFGAPDGQPVNILFTLVSPNIRAHMALLSALASALRDTAFKEAILVKRDATAIIGEASRADALAALVTARTVWSD